ncbi:MAG TPA: hypothetical protein VN428_00145 [Bryobacteraceae bacterium]|nr:hypothetical protein [Bryobacteraceae bacterium]
MTRRNALLLVPAALAAAQKTKRKKDGQPPELEVLAFGARRRSGVLEIDGRVRNCGERTLEKVLLIFHVVSPDGKVVTTQKGQLDPAVLEPGEESGFEWQARDHARAVTVMIGATNRGEDELVLLKPGPYPID